mgnify:FL=1
MNKILIALGLAATVALVGCKKDTPPETGATTGEHLENAAEQAGHDIAVATDHAASETAYAVDNAASHAESAAHNAKEAAKDATAAVAGSVEQGAANIREKAEN